MPARRDEAKAARLSALYDTGLSLAKVAEIAGVTRQSVFKMLARRNKQLRALEDRPAVFYKGEKFTLRENGYFASTIDDRQYLHRRMWEDENGPIPKGYDIHHSDGCKTNNVLKNFELLTKSEHGQWHGFAGCRNPGSVNPLVIR